MGAQVVAPGWTVLGRGQSRVNPEIQAGFQEEVMPTLKREVEEHRGRQGWSTSLEAGLSRFCSWKRVPRNHFNSCHPPGC